MTMQFGDSAGKHICFCCGVQFSNYEEFKTHILETHEEGRDFVRCPLEHCGAPVRDAKLHIKVKHPRYDLRNFRGQARAIVWHDFSAKGKKTKKPRFKQGKYESTKTGRVLGYRSGLEEKLYKVLDQHEDVLSFHEEPFNIDYIHRGQAHKYIPDLFVTFMDGHKELWEVKPTSQTDLEQNKNKWRAAEEACKIRGWKFQVFTEQGIEKLAQQVRRQVLDE